MRLSFAQKLSNIQRRKQSTIGLILSPRVEQLPLPIQRYDDPFLPFGKAVIEATEDIVCAYLFDFPAYLAIGAAGAIALERTIDYVGADAVTILHGAFVLPGYAAIADENAFGVDALTIGDNEYIDAFTAQPHRGAFTVRRENPSLNDAAQKGGIYRVEQGILTTLSESGDILQIRLADEGTIYTARGDNFAAVIRQRIEQMLHG